MWIRHDEESSDEIVTEHDRRMSKISKTDPVYNIELRLYLKSQVRPFLYISFWGSIHYTLSEAWSGVNWADLMAAQFTPLQASDKVYQRCGIN